MKSKYHQITLILLIVVVLATAGLFLLFMPEQPSWLYWFNMGYSIFLEILFFGMAFGAFSGNRGTGAPIGAGIASASSIFIFLSVATMLVYNLALTDKVSWKVYILVLAVLLVLTFVLGGFLKQADILQEEIKADVRKATETHQSFASDFDFLYRKAASLKDQVPGFNPESDLKELYRLKEKVHYLPPRSIERVPHLGTTLSQINEDCLKLISEISSNPENPSGFAPSVAKIRAMANEGLLYIESNQKNFNA
jgi:hypothetical protein